MQRERVDEPGPERPIPSAAIASSAVRALYRLGQPARIFATSAALTLRVPAGVLNGTPCRTVGVNSSSLYVSLARC